MTTDKHVEYALITQRDRAVEAMVWAHEKRDGWEEIDVQEKPCL